MSLECSEKPKISKFKKRVRAGALLVGLAIPPGVTYAVGAIDTISGEGAHLRVAATSTARETADPVSSDVYRSALYTRAHFAEEVKDNINNSTEAEDTVSFSKPPEVIEAIQTIKQHDTYEAALAKAEDTNGFTNRNTRNKRWMLAGQLLAGSEAVVTIGIARGRSRRKRRFFNVYPELRP